MSWHPFTTAPKDGSQVLLTWSDRGRRVIQPFEWRQGHWLHTWDHSMLQVEPTHWRPMPDGPAGA